MAARNAFDSFQDPSELLGDEPPSQQQKKCAQGHAVRTRTGGALRHYRIKIRSTRSQGYGAQIRDKAQLAHDPSRIALLVGARSFLGSTYGRLGWRASPRRRRHSVLNFVWSESST